MIACLRSVRAAPRPTTRTTALGDVEISAPGGWFRDGFGTPTFRTPGNEILSSYPARTSRSKRGSPTRTAHPPTSSRCRAATPPGLWLLHLPAGHVDGVPARDRGRGADRPGARPRQPARTGTRSIRPPSGRSSWARPRTTPALLAAWRTTPMRAVPPTGTRPAWAPRPTTGSTARASSTRPPPSAASTLRLPSRPTAVHPANELCQTQFVRGDGRQRVAGATSMRSCGHSRAVANAAVAELRMSAGVRAWPG